MNLIRTQVNIENLGRVLRKADEDLRRIYDEVKKCRRESTVKDVAKDADIAELNAEMGEKDADIVWLRKESDKETNRLKKVITDKNAEIARLEKVITDKPAPAKPDPFPAWKALSVPTGINILSDFVTDRGKELLLSGFLGDDATDNYYKNLLLAGDVLMRERYNGKKMLFVDGNGTRYWDVAANETIMATSLAHGVICAVYEVYKLYKKGELK